MNPFENLIKAMIHLPWENIFSCKVYLWGFMGLALEIPPRTGTERRRGSGPKLSDRNNWIYCIGIMAEAGTGVAGCLGLHSHFGTLRGMEVTDRDLKQTGNNLFKIWCD